MAIFDKPAELVEKLRKLSKDLGEFEGELRKMHDSYPLTGEVLVKHWPQGHSQARICPGCRQDCAMVGLTRLVYSFERCECEQELYPHLVEQVWHADCFRKEGGSK